jgi:hypothetical protein
MSRSGFDESYNRYLILRGYDPSSNKLLILRRAIVDSWGEPGFHRFWQVWNPGVGHLLYRLYLALGGNRSRFAATVLVFVLCGFAHDVLVMVIFQQPFVAFSTAFVLFGILAVINRSLESSLHQERWPRLVNILTNLLCLAASIYAAVQLQMLLFP